VSRVTITKVSGGILSLTRKMSQKGTTTHRDNLSTSAANKNEDPVEEDDAELAIETASSSSSVSKSKVESTSE
jgi:hypothetical protein